MNDYKPVEHDQMDDAFQEPLAQLARARHIAFVTEDLKRVRVQRRETSSCQNQAAPKFADGCDQAFANCLLDSVFFFFFIVFFFSI